MIIRIRHSKPPKPHLVRKPPSPEAEKRMQACRRQLAQLRGLQKHLRRQHKKRELAAVRKAMAVELSKLRRLERRQWVPEPPKPEAYRGVKPSLLLDPNYVPPPEARICPPTPPELPPVATVAVSTSSISSESPRGPETAFNSAGYTEKTDGKELKP